MMLSAGQLFRELTVSFGHVNTFQIEEALAIFKNADKVFFVGNGGSASIASHMAIDFSKNGLKPSLAFNDPSALTCLSNDFGYEHVFSMQLLSHAARHDALVAISSSGKSPNILRAVKIAKDMSIPVVTLSGFDGNNPLRKMGDVNFYVESDDYGVVEITHLAILHSMIGGLKVNGVM